MTLFDSYEYIWFAPSADERKSIHHLLELAIPIPDNAIVSLDPLYIMNVVEDSSTYRSLILTRTGNVFASYRSTAWVAETFFEHLGFRYETWNSFWLEMGTKPLPSLPYVNGKTVFLKVPRGLKHADWLNISHCVSIDWHSTLHRGVTQSPTLHFYFQLKQAEHVHLVVKLTQHCTLLSRQLALAIQLREAWQCYYTYLVSQHLPRHLVNVHDEWQERFALLAASAKKQQSIDPSWVETFQLYQTICGYIERGRSSQQRKVSRLLEKKHLDSQTLRLLLERYKREQDQDEMES